MSAAETVELAAAGGRRACDGCGGPGPLAPILPPYVDGGPQYPVYLCAGCTAAVLGELDRPLAPARGLVIGLVLALALWLAGLYVFFAVR